MNNEIKKIVDDLDLHELGSDLLKSLKVAGLAYKAYCYLYKRRIENFLLTLDGRLLDLNKNEQAKFKTYINSKLGFELLGTFIDTTLDSSSRIVHVALAILFIDKDNKKYSLEFKRTACLTLKNMSDFIVDAFMSIMENAKKINTDESEKNNPYQAYIIENNGTELINSPETLSIVINDLMSRGIIMKDHANMRFGSAIGIFGKSKFSEQVYKLFGEAKEVTTKNRLNIYKPRL